MRAAFDARIATPEVLRFIRECQSRVGCTLAGGVALSGAYLGHRLSSDVDLFFRDPAPDLLVRGRRRGAEFGHVAQHRDSPASRAGKMNERFQCCMHGIGIRIIGVIQHQKTIDAPQLQSYSRGGWISTNFPCT